MKSIIIILLVTIESSLYNVYNRPSSLATGLNRFNRLVFDQYSNQRSCHSCTSTMAKMYFQSKRKGMAWTFSTIDPLISSFIAGNWTFTLDQFLTWMLHFWHPLNQCIFLSVALCTLGKSEAYVSSLYETTKKTSIADELFYLVFCKNKQKHEMLPPMTDCVLHHLKQSNYKVSGVLLLRLPRFLDHWRVMDRQRMRSFLYHWQSQKHRHL